MPEAATSAGADRIQEAGQRSGSFPTQARGVQSGSHSQIGASGKPRMPHRCRIAVSRGKREARCPSSSRKRDLLLNETIFTNLTSARVEVMTGIEEDNRERRHLVTGYATPAAFAVGLFEHWPVSLCPMGATARSRRLLERSDFTGGEDVEGADHLGDPGRC